MPSAVRTMSALCQSQNISDKAIPSPQVPVRNGEAFFHQAPVVADPWPQFLQGSTPVGSINGSSIRGRSWRLRASDPPIPLLGCRSTPLALEYGRPSSALRIGIFYVVDLLEEVGQGVPVADSTLSILDAAGPHPSLRRVLMAWRVHGSVTSRAVSVPYFFDRWAVPTQIRWVVSSSHMRFRERGGGADRGRRRQGRTLYSAVSVPPLPAVRGRR